MKSILGHWYELTRPSGEKIIFKFKGESITQKILGELSNGEMIDTLFDCVFQELTELGKEKP